MKKLQFISLDEMAKSALECVYLNSAQTIHSDISTLASCCESEYQQVVVLSSLTYDDVFDLILALKEVNNPIMIVPNDNLDSSCLKPILTSNIAFISINNSGVLKVNLRESIEAVNSILTICANEDNIDIHEDDMKYIIRSGAINFLQISEARTPLLAVTQITNRVNTNLKENNLICATFVIDKNIPIIAFTEGIDFLARQLNEECNIIYQTRNEKYMVNRVKLYLIESIDYSLQAIVQRELDEETRYLKKLSIISENYYIGYLNTNETNELALSNELSLDDLYDFYTYTYKRTDETVSLMEHLRELNNDKEKEKLVAKALLDEVVDINVLEEISMTHNVDTDKVLAIYESLCAEKDQED